MRHVYKYGLAALVALFSLSPVPAAEKSSQQVAKSAESKHNQLSRQEIEAGWIRLFDGETTFGWKANSNANWKVADGAISADKGEKGLLVTTTKFADYELRCDYRLETGGNSGIFLRTPFIPKDPASDCYELNMCDTHPAFPTGSLVGRKKPANKIPGEGVWKTYHVKVLGNQVDVVLDGEPVLSYIDNTAAPLTQGFVGLQLNAGKAEYRNVYLRPLSTKPLFNGKDLTGWRVVPGGKSQFDVADGTIHARNGRGFLETEGTWGDFILQADIKTNGKHLNSGIFFRTQAGTAEAPSNGYECQVHNAFKDNDRAKPVDFGTGAIYRRIAARRVVPNDFEWFTMTLVADGPHIAAWVDGYQVTDWTDVRAPHDNPREGLRLAAGHFSLQGHDPTTDLSFRNLRVAEFPERTGKK